MTLVMFQNLHIHLFSLHHHNNIHSETSVKSMYTELQSFYNDVCFNTAEFKFDSKISINNFNKLMLKK